MILSIRKQVRVDAIPVKVESIHELPGKIIVTFSYGYKWELRSNRAALEALGQLAYICGIPEGQSVTIMQLIGLRCRIKSMKNKLIITK